jgi:hypothetical protein
VDAIERFARLLVDVLAECTRVGMAPPFTLLIYGRDVSPRKFRGDNSAVLWPSIGAQ